MIYSVLINKITTFLHINTLKKRVSIILILNSLIPLTLIGVISYNSIFSLLNTKVTSGIQNNLEQVELSMENNLKSLTQASQQLAYDGGVGKDLNQFLTETDRYKRIQLNEEINSSINLINFTNPNLGLTFYYFAKTGARMYENYSVSDNFNINKLPLFEKDASITYYGPYKTMSRNNDNYVISISRKVDIPGADDLYLYIESNFQLSKGLISVNQYGMNIQYLIVDNKGRIAYSENQKNFPVGENYVIGKGIESFDKQKGYYLFNEKSTQGWAVIGLISGQDYNHERDLWLKQFIFFSLVSICISIFLSIILWITVNKPLKNFNAEISSMSLGNYQTPLHYTKLREYDEFLEQFNQMRIRILELIGEVKQKEKHEAFLEVEKLLYQINPHFIHNTLDTIRWMARLKGEEEIDVLISSLNRLLYYNLGKANTSTIQEEINALEDYVKLQKVKYDFEFNVEFNTDTKYLGFVIPRFILQPLVENSLFHGLNGFGVISIEINKVDEDFITLKVSDNGVGMSADMLQSLLNEKPYEKEKMGMGIGLNYVRRMIKIQYGETAQITIVSSTGSGTATTLYLPIDKGADTNA